MPETIWLAGEAGRLGAAAASAFGAGFGGAVWALVREPEARGFLRRWRAGYEARFGARRHAAWFLTPPARPARRV